MAVKLVFLGKLADLVGRPDMDVPGPLDWPTLLALLPESLTDAVQGPKVRIAVDGALLADKFQLAAVDASEVALLPPVSGG
jgi:molybdopterin synthase sulfur carrier subunit